MADYRIPSDTEATEKTIIDIVSRHRHVLPGYIESFDENTNLVSVIGGIRMKYSVRGEVEYIRLPIVVKVPLVLPYSQIGELALTMPIRKGDECLLLYSDRFLDDFVQNGTRKGQGAFPEMNGGNNETTEVRIFDETDAIAMPGLCCLKTSLPNWNNNAIELRNKNRTAFISLGTDSNITIQTTGNVTVVANGDITANGNNIYLNN